MSSVRRLADNLGVSKDTTARALRRLTSAHLIAALPAPRADRGRFGGGAYLICAATPRAEVEIAAERAAASLESRRPRVRSVAGFQPTLFDAPGDEGAAAKGSSPEREGAGVGTAQDAGRGEAEAGARTGRRADAGREDPAGQAEVPGRRAAG